jgi:hypothetical protein
MEALTDLASASYHGMTARCSMLPSLSAGNNLGGHYQYLSDWVTNWKYAQSLPHQANLKYPNQD